MCKFPKFVKPKAEIFIKKNGQIIGNNCSTSTILGLPNIDLTKTRLSNLKTVLEVSSINFGEVFRFNSAGNIKIKPSSTESVSKDKDIGFLRQMTQKNEMTKSSALIPYMDTALHFEFKKALNIEKSTLLLELWKQDLSSASKTQNLNEEFSEDNDNDTRTKYEPSGYPLSSKGMNYTNKSKVVPKTKNRFFFRIDENVKYEGSFDKKSYSTHSNLNQEGLKYAQLNKDGKKLFDLKSKLNSQNDICNFNLKVNYATGIRVKRLKGDGHIVDWYEGIDGTESEIDEQDEFGNFGRSRGARGSVLGYPNEALIHSFKKIGKKGSRKSTKQQKKISEKNDKNSHRRKRRTSKYLSKKEIPVIESPKLNQHLKSLNKKPEPTHDYNINMKYLKALSRKKELIKMLEGNRMDGLMKFALNCEIMVAVVIIFSTLWSLRSRSTLAQNLISFARVDQAITLRNSDLYNIQSNLNDICLINNGTNMFFPQNSSISGQELQRRNKLEIEDRIRKIRASLESYEAFNLEMITYSPGLTKIDVFNSLLSKRNISVMREMSSSQTAQNFSLAEASRQIVTSVMNILDQPDKSFITLDNADVSLLLYNGRNEIIDAMVDFLGVSDIIKQDAFKKIQEITRNRSIANLVLLGFFIPLLYCFGFCFYKKRENFIEKLYGFDQEDIELLTKKSDKFLSWLQLTQLESKDEAKDLIELKSSEDESMSEEDGGLGSGRAAGGLGYGSQGFRRRRKGGRGKKKEMTIEEMLQSLRKKKRKKGSLIPLFGFFHTFLILPLVYVLWDRYWQFLHQNRVIDATIEVLEVAENLAISEMVSYEALISLEYSMYDFSGLGSKGMGSVKAERFSLREERAYYLDQISKVNDQWFEVIF